MIKCLMTNKEILRKAIGKAIEHGYEDKKILTLYSKTQGKGIEIIANTLLDVRTEKIIFSHSFAKAFWGEKVKRIENGYGSVVQYLPEWKFHLRQMVLEEIPILYLEKFL